MGGRGSGSSSGGGGGGKGANNFIKRPDGSIYDPVHNINATATFVKTVGEERAERYLKLAGDTLDEFGIQKGTLDVIHADEIGAGTYAHSFSFGGKVEVNTSYFGDEARLNSIYQQDLRDGFHPAGTNADAIIAHEVGHNIQGTLNQKMAATYGMDWSWYIGQQGSTQVVSEAVKRVKKTEYGKGRLKNDLVSSLSGYARKNAKETISEAIGDYMQNRSKANPLSIAIVNIIKEEFAK